ncbi:MAG TPA: indole-3-glycerol phosphate synthase TrpC [Candidatus Omnitrophota bacterium]|nr:indole-3-glycerol phosphate synthase TrpC [Candidatus Omnitrophota bacterium]HPN87733.1 indole-3-glycerol phosphate synthase TrpC [Candidatus Omnitrophota bacterium]
MEADFLQQIISHKRHIIETKKEYFLKLKDHASCLQTQKYHVFKKSISAPDKISLIAEIKKASPSKGLIRENFDVLSIAKTYEEQGAAGISVLTEDRFFLGSISYLKKVADCVHVPVLAKDFFIDEGQIYEAHAHGASAVLLIMAILKDHEVKQLMNVARSLDVDCLVEVHNREEFLRALDCGAEIIGINNRDLKTFHVDLRVAEELIPQIPKDKVIVVESGIHFYGEVKRFKELGAQAVLIGETFMREQDIAQKIKEVMYGQS